MAGARALGGRVSEVTRREALDAAARWLRACDNLGNVLLSPEDVTERLRAHAEIANAWGKLAFIVGRDEDERGT